MKISVTVINSRTESPVADARVVLSVDGNELVTLYTSGAGKAEHIEKSGTAGSILSWIVEAEGFELGKGELDIDQPEEEVTVYLVPEVEEQPPAPPEKPPASPPEFFIVDESGNPLDGAKVDLEQRGKRIGSGISTQGVVMLSGTLSRLKRGEPLVYRIDKEGFYIKSDKFELGEEGSVQKVTLVRAVPKWPLRRLLKWASITGIISTLVLLYLTMFLLLNSGTNVNRNLDALRITSISVTVVIAAWFGLTLWAFFRARKL